MDGEGAGAFSETDQGDPAGEGVCRIQGDLPVEVDVVGELSVVKSMRVAVGVVVTV